MKWERDSAGGTLKGDRRGRGGGSLEIGAWPMLHFFYAQGKPKTGEA